MTTIDTKIASWLKEKSTNSKEQKYLEWLEEDKQQIINIFGDVHSQDSENKGLIFHKRNINKKGGGKFEK